MGCAAARPAAENHLGPQRLEAACSSGAACTAFSGARHWLLDCEIGAGNATESRWNEPDMGWRTGRGGVDGGRYSSERLFQR